jgi:single-stranded DNA-binding protein
LSAAWSTTPSCAFNNGTPVASLRVAVTQRVLEDGAWRDGQTSFFKVNVRHEA